MSSLPYLRIGFLAICAATIASAQSATYDTALKLYNSTNYEESLKVLSALNDRSAAATTLVGRNYFGLGDYKKATEILQSALDANPSSSEIALWLGRAYGRRAETSNPLSAPGLASKARQNFEKAVQLGPRNVEAFADLFEYYMDAPGFLGGGTDKATALAARIAQIDAAEGQWAQAKLAEKRKDWSASEAAWRRAAELAPKQPGRALDLARFYARQGRLQDADQSLERAARLAPDSPSVIYGRAEVYILGNRNLDTARELLRRYIDSSSLTPDDATRAEARKLLKKAGG